MIINFQNKKLRKPVNSCDVSNRDYDSSESQNSQTDKIEKNNDEDDDNESLKYEISNTDLKSMRSNYVYQVNNVELELENESLKYQISDQMLIKSSNLIKNTPEENTVENQMNNDDDKNQKRKLRLKKKCNII